VFLDSKEKQNSEESSPTSVNVAQMSVLKEMSLELSSNWVLIRSDKTTSDHSVHIRGGDLFLKKES
jgi:hypothetical protein